MALSDSLEVLNRFYAIAPEFKDGESEEIIKSHIMVIHTKIAITA